MKIDFQNIAIVEYHGSAHINAICIADGLVSISDCWILCW